MKQKKLKGFTLVELMVVVALLGLLMLMITAFIKPIGALFKSVSDMDTKQTAADGINEYILGSIKYADNLYMFTDFDTFPTRLDYMKDDGTRDTMSVMDVFYKESGLDPSNLADVERIKVIYVVNDAVSGPATPQSYASVWGNGETYLGRVFRSDRLVVNDGDIYDLQTNFPPKALGDGYYGKNDFFIMFRNTLTPSGNLTDSTKDEIRITTQRVNHTTGGYEEKTENTAAMLNASLSNCFRVINGPNTPSEIDSSYYATDGTGTSGRKTWIIYTTPKE